MRRLWQTAIVLAAAPFVATLCVVLWRTPFPLTEAVALFEDVANRAPSQFLIPDTAYYRPLFHLALSAFWHNAGSLDATLAGIKLLHIVPVILLVSLFIWCLRPRTAVDAIAALIALTVLVGSRGFRDNLEIPLSYTIVGMPLALAVWMLVNRPPRAWTFPAVIALTLVAIGFKEQGLVVVPVVVAAWWMRAPGASRRLAVTVAALAAIYVAIRLTMRGSGPMFEQAVGFGFSEMEPPEAFARFGDFPYGIYAYSSLSTILNVLFSEPTRGVFSITRFLISGYPEIWQMTHLLSSAAVTGLVAWWGIRSLRRDRGAWSTESRLFVVLIVALCATGVLSFNYSRDRLGGMAVPFYALAAFFAVREALRLGWAEPRARRAVVALALIVLAAAWQTRALATIEFARIFAARNQFEWYTRLPERREEFAGRTVYLQIMDAMIEQGTEPDSPRQTRYPRLVNRTLGLPDEGFTATPFADSLAQAIERDDVQWGHAYIRAGQDPNEPIVVSHPVLTGGRQTAVSPLAWAAALNRERSVRMLLGFGATASTTQPEAASCIARALGHTDIAALIERYGDSPSPRCQERTDAAPVFRTQ